MKLEEKVMYLYEDILGPEQERKIVLLLKYVIIDRETNLKTIKKEIHITDEFIQTNINNDSVMLKYLTEEELKKFRLKMDLLLGKNQILIKLIKLILEENETNLEKIVNSVPITVQTIKSYMNNKEKMLRYLTEEEYNKLLNIVTPLVKPKTKLEKLIQAVMVDRKTDLLTIEKEYCIRRKLIKKHMADTQELQKFLSKENINIFINKLNKMFEELQYVEYQKDRKYVAQIINDILDTRHLYADICAKHLFSVNKFEKYLYNEEYMKKEFPKITVDVIKGKIKENETIRIRCPYNMYVIEDRYCVMITKKDVHYLNQFDIKKLNVVSYYLGTGANLDAVLEYFKIGLPEFFAMVESSKIKEILNEPYQIIFENCLNIENMLYKNDLNAKKAFIIELTDFLEKNNFDIELTMKYYNIPVPLFNRVVKEIIKLPYASNQVKESLNNVQNIESPAKSK